MRALATTLLLASISACASPMQMSCTPDDDALARRTECIADDDCPCGAHCDVGICAYDCRSSADCTNGACDRFGRCVTREGAIGDVSFANAVRVRVDGAPVALDPAHAEGVLTLNVEGDGAPGPVRIRGRRGARVRCALEGGFVEECLLEDLSPTAPRPVFVTAADVTTEGDATVEVTHEHGSETIVITTGARTTPAPVAFEGVWEGNAYLVGAGSLARPSSTVTSQALAELAFPVRAIFHPEVGNVRPVELSSIDEVVFPESPTIGELRRGSDGAFQLRHARRAFVETPGAEAANVLASARSTSVERSGGTLSISLATTYFGAATDETSPILEWRIVLRRIADLPDGSTPPSIASDLVLGATVDRAAMPLGMETAAEASLASALEGVTAPAVRAQRALCSPTGASVVPRIFTSDVPATRWSGDLLCREDREAATEELAPLALGPYTATSFDIATTIPGCVSDLARMIDTRDGTTPSGSGSGCIDGPRFALALIEASAVDRARAAGAPTPPDLVASAIEHRLVQQWSEMMAFVATQSVQIDRLNDVLGDGVGSTDIERDFDQLDMLEQTAAGWDLLLHPRVATALAAMPGSVIARADYRARLFPATTFPTVRHHDQGVGAPVALASALARSIEAHGALLDRSRYVTRDLPRAIELSRAFARRSLVLFSLATAMHETARAAVDGDLAWELEWERASRSYGDALTHLVRALELARRGGNPLGIDDALDLPLYRVGDEATPLARFSALTDYLLGTDGSGDTSPAGSAVAAAEARRAEARSAFSTALVRDFAEETEESLANRRIAAVSLGYGGDLQSLCGDPELDPDAAVAGEEDVDPETCWIRPDCRRTGAEAIASLPPARVAEGLCTWRRLSERAAVALGAQRAAAATLRTPIIDQLLAGTVTVRGMTPRDDGTAEVVFSDGSSFDLPAELLDGSVDPTDPAGDVPSEDLAAIDAECRVVATSSDAGRPGEVPASCAYNGDCPSGYLCRAAACVVDVGTDEEPSCYRGYVGELAIGLRGAVTDIEVARSEANELTESYRIRMEQCTNLIEANDARQRAIEHFNDTMNAMGAVRLAMQVAANAAGAVLECSSANTDGVAGLTSKGATCGAAFAQAAFQSAADGLEYGMEVVEREHEAAMAEIDAALEEDNCRLEADLELVGVRTAALRIQRASEEVSAQYVALENAKSQIRVTLRSGRSEYARELADAVPPIEFDYWLNTTAVEYDAAFRRARRALYLGVLAIEYEYQLSSSERTAVLSATSVTELRGTLTRLRNLAATGTVGGAAPSPLLSVVSLRGELLAITDRSGDAEGEQRLTDVERFRMLLASPRFASYDEDGTYLGQEIPFRVAPFAASGATGAVPIFAGEDCAERIWSMNASILGTSALVGTDSTRTRITLRKRNTFFSQWCSRPADGSPFQISATRPSRNLFLDPTTDFVPSSLDPRAGTFDELHLADAFASARLQPVLGVTRAALEADDYFNGSSRELAGRSLYGDYALFIPVESLSRSGGPGLDLSRVDDVLVRFDYVSVAR